MSDFLAKNVQRIRAGVDHHNRTCPIPARAILLHPSEHEKLETPDLWGLAVYADERVRLGYFRIDCEGSAWNIEEELALHIEIPTGTPSVAPGVPAERPLAARGTDRTAD